MSSLFSEDRSDSLGDLLSDDIAYIGALLGGTGDNVLPHSLKLCVGQRPTLAVGYHKIRSGFALCFAQALSNVLGDRNISTSGFGLQLGRNHQTIVLGVPRSSDRDIGGVTVQIYAVPLQVEDFFSSQTGIQADHNENIRRQTFDRRKELDDLLVSKSFLILLRLSSLCRYAFAGGIIDDVAIDCGVENCLPNMFFRTRIRLCRQRDIL